MKQFLFGVFIFLSITVFPVLLMAFCDWIVTLI